jgi:hypothetical protein
MMTKGRIKSLTWMERLRSIDFTLVYNIGLRVVVQELDHSMVFNGGNGDLAYKSYKHLLITKHLNYQIRRIAVNFIIAKFYRALRRAFLQAANKGDAEIMACINDSVCVRGRN